MLPRQGSLGGSDGGEGEEEEGEKVVLVNWAAGEYGSARSGDGKHESHGGEAGRD